MIEAIIYKSYDLVYSVILTPRSASNFSCSWWQKREFGLIRQDASAPGRHLDSMQTPSYKLAMMKPLAILSATLMLLSATGAEPGKQELFKLVSVKETKKLKAVRDKIGEIRGLDKIYEDRTHKNGLPYHIYIPKNLKVGVSYPLVTFLHGYTDLTLDTHRGFPKGVWSLPEIQKAHPHILFVPRNRTKEDKWTSDEYRKMTIQALDDLVSELNGDAKRPDVDLDRLYLTGFSRGGQGTWNFVRNYPEKFAAAVPLSGYFHGPQNVEEAKAIKNLPIWIFNGDGDRGVKGSRVSFKALRDAGAVDVRYHEYQQQGHVIDDFAYFTDGFMDWLFAQKRGAK